MSGYDESYLGGGFVEEDGRPHDQAGGIDYYDEPGPDFYGEPEFDPGYGEPAVDPEYVRAMAAAEIEERLAALQPEPDYGGQSFYQPDEVALAREQVAEAEALEAGLNGIESDIAFRGLGNRPGAKEAAARLRDEIVADMVEDMQTYRAAALAGGAEPAAVDAFLDQVGSSGEWIRQATKARQALNHQASLLDGFKGMMGGSGGTLR